MLLGLILVMGLMAAAAWALKRLQSVQFRQGGIIKILGSVGVGPQGRIVVIEVGGQWLVVGVTSSRMDVLATLHKKPSPNEDGRNGSEDEGNLPGQLKSTQAAHDDD